MSERERKRASLFGDGSEQKAEASTSKRKIDLGRFEPQQAPTIDRDAAEKLGQEEGFSTKHSRPSTTRGRKVDGRSLKKSPRTSQFNVRLKPTTSERFWNAAKADGAEYADEFLEKLLDVFERN